MAVKSGVAQQFYIHGFDLSGDVSEIIRCSGSKQAGVITGLIDKAMRRLLGRADGEISFRTWFNDATRLAHEALKAMVTTNRIVSWVLTSDNAAAAIGDESAHLVSKQITYDFTEEEDASLSAEVQTLATGGVAGPEYLTMITAGKITHSSATNGTSRDDSASSSLGAVAVLQVVDIASGTPTFILQDSTDNSVFATLISFTAVADGSEPTAERKTVTGTVNRYVRAQTTGTFTDADFAMAYRRGLTADDLDLS